MDPQQLAFWQNLQNFSDEDLAGIAGALVAEMVNRGNDTETALEFVIDGAKSGAEASKEFDAIDTMAFI